MNTVMSWFQNYKYSSKYAVLLILASKKFTQKCPSKFMLIMAAIVWSVAPKKECPMMTAALLMRISTGPKSSSTFTASADISAEAATFTVYALVTAPGTSATISRAVSSLLVWSTSTQATNAPSLANSMARARPRPLPVPVIYPRRNEPLNNIDITHNYSRIPTTKTKQFGIIFTKILVEFLINYYYSLFQF